MHGRPPADRLSEWKWPSQARKFGAGLRSDATSPAASATQCETIPSLVATARLQREPATGAHWAPFPILGFIAA
jgi:hypothetical protein